MIDDLCILAKEYNQLVNIIKIIDNWTKEMELILTKKNIIMIVKGNEERNEINGYQIFNEYK